MALLFSSERPLLCKYTRDYLALPPRLGPVILHACWTCFAMFVALCSLAEFLNVCLSELVSRGVLEMIFDQGLHYGMCSPRVLIIFYIPLDQCF